MSLINRLRRCPLLLDGLFAVAVGALVIAGSIVAARDQTDMTPLDLRAYALLVVGAAGLVVRRHLPAVAAAVTFVATMTYVFLRYPYGPVFIFAAVAFYSAAVWRSPRFAVTRSCCSCSRTCRGHCGGKNEPDTPLFVSITTAVWLASPLAVGTAVRTQRQAHARSLLEDRHRHVYEERLRIAQEVHDVVGHSLAVISMNAGAALHVLTKQPGPARVTEVLRAIRQTSSGAVDELRSTLTGVGSGPGLDALPSLVEATNVGPLTATLTVTGEGAHLPSTVNLAGYRIAQESLTNVVRHAAAHHVTVTVEHQPGRVTLTIADDGRGGPIRPGGSGLQSSRYAQACRTRRCSHDPGGHR